MAKPKRPLLAKAAEIRAIFQNALALFESVQDIGLAEDPDDRERIAELNIRNAAGFEALRFCCVAAGLARDPSLLPLVAESLEILEGERDDAEDHREVMAMALTDLLEAGAPVDADVEGLARHADEEVRRAVAAGLKPRGERAIALLNALAADPSADVRRAARGSLEEVQEVAWWQGKFRSDPAARLDAADVARLKPALERLSELLDRDQSWLPPAARAELAELAGALPDALALELTELWHAGGSRHRTADAGLLAVMISREGGLDALARLCARWVEDGHDSVARPLAQAITSLPEPRRVEVCLALSRRIAALPERGRDERPAGMMAEAAGLAWPPGRDLTPMLDVLLSIPPHSNPHRGDMSASSMARGLLDGADPGPILDRLLEARLAGYPGAWSSIGWQCDKMLERASGPALRLAAERAALSDDGKLAAWGIGSLLGAAHDPARDGPLSAVVERLLADPRARRVILDHHELSRRAVAPMRAALRAGQLSYPEACTAIRIIGAVWGGVADSNSVSTRLDQDEDELEKWRAKAREALGPFLGPPELHGPPTAEEWAMLRAARAIALTRPGPGGGHEDEREGQPPLGLAVLPVGPWSPEDRAVLDAALARMRAGDGDAALPIGLMLAGKLEEADFPLFDELVARVDHETKPLLRGLRSGARDALGLRGQAAGGGGGAGGDDGDDGEDDDEQREWMDEEDD